MPGAGAGVGVLSGHLRDYTLADLIGVLHHRRATGRLSVGYEGSPADFYLVDGELVHARVGDTRGVRAVALAVKLPEAPFRFYPHVSPPERTISAPLRGPVLELLGCWLEEAPTEGTRDNVGGAGQRAGAGVTGLSPGLGTSRVRDLLLRAASGARARPDGRVKLALIAACVVALAAVASAYLTGAMTGGNSRNKSNPAAAAPAARTRTEAPPQTPTRAPSAGLHGQGRFGGVGATEESLPDTTAAEGTQTARRPGIVKPVTRRPGRAAVEPATGQEARATAAPRPEAGPAAGTEKPNSMTVRVVTVIEGGRVVRAYVADPRPGRGEFEAAALRAARQRRYPPGKNGSEEVRITVSSQ